MRLIIRSIVLVAIALVPGLDAQRVAISTIIRLTTTPSSPTSSSLRALASSSSSTLSTSTRADSSSTTSPRPVDNAAAGRRPLSTRSAASTTTSTTSESSSPTTRRSSNSPLRSPLSFLSSSAFPTLVPRNVPPTGSTYDYGNTVSSQFSNLYRDGGGGITINGYNLMVFSDSFTTTDGPYDTITSFVANTFAYAGTTSDPRYLVDFGSGSPKTQVNLLPNETASQPANGRYAIWPSQSLISYDFDGHNVALGVMPMVRNLQGGVIEDVYTTLVQVETTPSGPIATRLVQALFYVGEPQFGKFDMLKGPDGFTYLFASDQTGVKVARVTTSPALAITDRRQYQYYNGRSWTSTMPALNDASANIFNFQVMPFAGVIVSIYSGEIFFSPYHNTYLIVFMDGFVDGTFRVAYSTNGQITGPWSSVTDLYQSARVPKASNQWNYAGHAYPGRDESGATLALSYTYDFNYINFATLTWCDPAVIGCSATASGFLGGQ